MSSAPSILRLQAAEYGSPIRLVDEISTQKGIARDRAKTMVLSAGDRAAKHLGYKNGLIETSPNGERPVDFAGVLRIGPGIELEVAPKFLGIDSDSSGWREDFFFLATLSKHGSLLINDRLSSSASATRRDLSTLVGHALATMYRDNERRPLRTYRIARESDFSIDGDVDPIDFVLPSGDGFLQEQLRYDRRNPYNSAIRGAADELAIEVSDPSVRSRLRRVVDALAPQRRPNGRIPARVPSRARLWQPTHSLALDVLEGFGVSYRQGRARAPGYVVDTWRIWQHLLEVAARLGFGADASAAEQGFSLGSRKRPGALKSTSLNVFPDLIIRQPDLASFVLDAKYKGNVVHGRLRIEEADVYETLAFMQATDSQLAILAYPETKSPGRAGVLGRVTLFEAISVRDHLILGVEIDCQGVSGQRGLSTFSCRVAENIAGLIKAHSVSSI